MYIKNINELKSIYLNDVNIRKFDNLTGNKFLLTDDNFSILSSVLYQNYRSVKVDGRVLQKHSSIYFDSSNMTQNIESLEYTAGLTNIEENRVYEELNSANKFSVSFHRIMLINKDESEVFTADFNINFNSNNNYKPLKNIVIIEHFTKEQSAPFLDLLDENGICSMNFSKYSIGKAFCSSAKKIDSIETTNSVIKKITSTNGGRWHAIS